MGEWQDPWHTLVVTVLDIWYCEDPGTCLVKFEEVWRSNPQWACPGHQESAPDRYNEPEITTELTHPENCKRATECCCPGTDMFFAMLTDRVCVSCRQGWHTDCSQLTWEYQCCTEQDVKELYDDNDLPRVSGTYRVRSSGWGPDYEGDYDQECEWEPLEDQSPTAA